MADEQPASEAPEGEAKPAAPAEAKTAGKTMHVKVYAPFRVYFDGLAVSISAGNDTGSFDILPGHHNFMTLLNNSEIIVRHAGGEEKVPTQRGIMHVKADEVIVFLDV